MFMFVLLYVLNYSILSPIDPTELVEFLGKLFMLHIGPIQLMDSYLSKGFLLLWSQECSTK